ncbi:crossover junction endonuclease MUS81 isoform X1 [Bombus vosnesenskii]|uniref:Crossover junction endonuclease MUS81 n=1 Tax=Bombus vosnesenskii TaxID=207650 RepID=A0A6J3K719_9HYME|nr:crossover junction endonuclease MUS81 isoform X1 [Bombus vancouverensis nearcticus]XP_033348857.1 crossover junction endonuclease MUS81 isoform X1 [Bombus vosnesenskii]
MKRIKLKPKNPNPLFELWLEEWRKEAASRNSDLQYHFSKALAALKKYPLPLKSGKDCIILQHFGTKLCSMLDRKLKEYKVQNNDSVSVKNVCKHCSFNEQPVFKRKRRSQQIIVDADFVPERTELTTFDDLNLSSWNVENYAALLILYKKTLDSCYLGYTTETDLLLEMKQLCGHGAKTSVLDLFESGLISMIGRPIRYNLTEHGISISKKICEITTTDVISLNSFEVLNKIQNSLKPLITQKSKLIKDSADLNNRNEETITIENHCQQPDENFEKRKSKENIVYPKRVQEKMKEVKDMNHVHNLENNETDFTDDFQRNYYLESRNFDIILLVDTQETAGGRTEPQHDATITGLTEFGVSFEIRHLKVGDFAWIARCRKNKNNELILPFIVERKRIDDLSASITDGRFHEQKFRLKQSGITNLMYIIEDYEKGQRLTIPHSSLMQASINTLIQDGFSVKYTKNHKDSMFYLSSLTRILIKMFKEKNLIGCKKEVITRTNISNNTCSLMVFEEFNKAASKQKVFKVNQMFVRQLLQLKGMSIDKALAIVEHYPTPRLLVEAFQKSGCNGELLLAAIEFGDKKRLIGSVISKTIYQLYMKKDLN